MTPAISVLDRAGVAYRIHEYERGEELRDFGREAADALGFPTEQVFKTLVVAGDVGLAVAVIPVSCQLSLKSVAAVFGWKRATMADPAAAQRSTGYVVGGISPIGQKRALPTVVDETAGLFETVYVSGGRRGLDIELSPADLVDVLGATTADISG
ncbi:MAG: Cys-tRNA(Pro) deacylase [Ilumatobacteraceae bacterium]